MSRSRLTALLLALVTVLTVPAAASAAGPSIFPTDALTVPDPQQVTGRRVALVPPDCSARPSDCNDVRLVNELDGFDLDPRVAIRFDRPIDVRKVTPETVYLQAVGGGPRIGLNRLVWSPARTTLFGQPREFLAESTTYRIVVTPAVSGQGAQTTFTTMTATAALQQMRRQLDDGSAYDAAGIAAADRGLRFVRPDGTRTVFNAVNVRDIRRFDDTGSGELRDSSVINTARANAGTYAFGSFLSPSWLTPERTIPQVATRTGSPRVTGFEEVGFTLILPRGTKPAGGWPVAIFGPGITRSKYDVFLAADENAARGIATMAIDPVGHAFGPRSEAAVDLAVPPTRVRFSGFGRGIDLDRDGTITEREGVQAPGQPHPVASVGLRDGLRQTALDNMALVRAIARGADVDGDGSADLRPTGVTYYAQSLGGIYGTMLLGVDPLVRVGALNVPGGPILEIARLSPSFRPTVAKELGNRRPSLLNGGRDGFTESQPLYADPPVTAPARGAVPIQEVGAHVNWINRPGSPEAFAPLLRKSPAADVGPKRVFYQFAFGDATVPNPTSATIVRAGGLLDVTTLYRNDRTPTRASNPHGFLLDPRITGRNLGQRQILDFLASDGRTISDPDGGAPVFDVPIADPATLERLNFDRPPAEGEPPPERPARAPRSPGRAPDGERAEFTRQIHLLITPRRARAGRGFRLRVRTVQITRPEQRLRALAGVTIRVAGRRVRTDRRGRAAMTLRVRHHRTVRVRATRRGMRSDTDLLRVVRRRR
jgi:hypothetical protein